MPVSVAVPGLAEDSPAQAESAIEPKPTIHGKLVIQSKPSGARVYINGSLAGQTPYTVTYAPPGEYAVRLYLDYYKRVYDTLTVKKDKLTHVRYSLKTHTVWEDSVQNVRRDARRLRRTIVRTVLGAGCVAFGGAAALFESQAKTATADLDATRSAYVKASSGFENYHAGDAELSSTIKARATSRKISLVLSGVCASGFGVTFLF